MPAWERTGEESDFRQEKQVNMEPIYEHNPRVDQVTTIQLQQVDN